MENNYLKHYGVAGQKWGVRKQTQASDNKKSSPQDLKTRKEKGKKATLIALGVIGSVAAAGVAATAAYKIGQKVGRSALSAELHAKRSAAAKRGAATRAYIKKILAETIC